MGDLPVKSNMRTAYRLSIFVALLLALTSLTGLLAPFFVYPTADLRRAFLANDVVNLFIGLPVLLISLWLARRGQLIGLLFLPGALLYVTYNSIAYAVAMPLTLSFWLNLAPVVLSAYAILRLLSSVDAPAVSERLKSKVAERFCGGALIGFGILIIALAVSELSSTDGSRAELSVRIADLLTAPFWVIGGILLWRKHPLGYASGAGLLFQASMLFVGLLVFFILQPFVSGVPFPLADFVMILLMGLVCFVPFGMFARGMMNK
ncbi:MAG: hypothetical protein HY865_23290 [Chloroflexi bacterium]|nr:hypothetical protein [Chloroflexota bacterium]